MRLLQYNDTYDIVIHNKKLKQIAMELIKTGNYDVPLCCMEMGIVLEDFYGWLSSDEVVLHSFSQWQLINLLSAFGIRIQLHVEA